jgi:hypothetical protein
MFWDMCLKHHLHAKPEQVLQREYLVSARGAHSTGLTWCKTYPATSCVEDILLNCQKRELCCPRALKEHHPTLCPSEFIYDRELAYI